jgi:putative transposase
VFRGLYAQQIEGKFLKDIRQPTNKGSALGNKHFFADIESLTGRRVIERKRGKPVGWRNNKSEVKALNY